ncbi:Protein F41C3.5 [Aphelenchoides avenae]|nr:Protein F41C3.5 [Aphelenchus avenae]
MEAFHAVTVVLLLAFSLASAVNEIKDLPGLTFDVKFKHYSGYLKASATRHLHYWLVESQRNPSTDPLVFWFNGGPGCSSLIGLFGEHGPYELSFDNSTLRENPYTWNKFANVVYMESPAGVGFAYVDKDDDGVYNDNRTSAESYEAIKQFFVVHPEFRNRQVFISGESYAGIYVPTLAARVVDGQKDYPLNFTGIIIDNGLVDIPLAFTTQAAWLYARGFVDESTWSDLKKCCKGDVDDCDYTSLDDGCQFHFFDVFQIPGKLWKEGHMNAYDVYRNCTIDPSASLFQFPVQAAKRRDDIHRAYGPDIFGWPSTMRPQVNKTLASGVRALLYYGDTDAVCNSLLGQKFAASLGLKQKTPKTPWMYGAELGGFKTVYEGGLTYVTVRGVGHMVPQFKPAESQQVIRRFLADEEI